MFTPPWPITNNPFENGKLFWLLIKQMIRF